MTDVALDPYTSHGQDGVLDDTGASSMTRRWKSLTARQAHAEAGVDIVAPAT